MKQKIVIPDTSALLRNTQLINKLTKDYKKVVIPEIVINELNGIKNNKQELGKKAWEILNEIKNANVSIVKYNFFNRGNNDQKIIFIAEKISTDYRSKVEIITEDIDYMVYLKDNNNVSAIRLKEYLNMDQRNVDIEKMEKVDAFYADSYENITLSTDEANTYLSNGNTLIISIVRNTHQPITYRKNKIRWLISKGADINKRDSGRRNFPPLSHAIQMNDYEIFKFLLEECRVNPNVGSRNPKCVENVRQKNEGNMPIMIAAWDGKDRFLKELLKDSRTSINQQDANGFTALIKACANGNNYCEQLLLEAGADTKILDVDGHDYIDHKRHFERNGQLRKTYNQVKK